MMLLSLNSGRYGNYSAVTWMRPNNNKLTTPIFFLDQDNSNSYDSNTEKATIDPLISYNIIDALVLVGHLGVVLL